MHHLTAVAWVGVLAGSWWVPQVTWRPEKKEEEKEEKEKEEEDWEEFEK